MSHATSPTERFHPTPVRRRMCTPVPATVGAIVKAKAERPCSVYIDLTLRAPGKVSFLTFRNYFTYSISVSHREEQGGENWRTVLSDYVLMSDPHSEHDAQKWTCIDVFKEFHRTFDCFHVHRLRIHLKQPSPNWLSFTLHNIQVWQVQEEKRGVPESAVSVPQPQASGVHPQPEGAAAALSAAEGAVH
eukprot:TRINITY_DN16071_c0_g1_i1.p1 TRINITY_DN16071_c0_g1~~TRINITY_DN16071_c0_g1_i1.p1  ORF type:complete len:215 (+),score=21.73 TRINITY_DN16071_c0_g1_i1:79-645(+)